MGFDTNITFKEFFKMLNEARGSKRNVSQGSKHGKHIKSFGAATGHESTRTQGSKGSVRQTSALKDNLSLALEFLINHSNRKFKDRIQSDISSGKYAVIDEELTKQLIEKFDLQNSRYTPKANNQTQIIIPETLMGSTLNSIFAISEYANDNLFKKYIDIIIEKYKELHPESVDDDGDITNYLNENELYKNSATSNEIYEGVPISPNFKKIYNNKKKTVYRNERGNIPFPEYMTDKMMNKKVGLKSFRTSY